MTPELGVTQLVDNFMNNRKATQKLIGPIAWEECKHLTPDKQAAILANVPEHEHDMRMLGVPFFGSGLVYPIAENRIKCEPFEYSGLHWWRCIRAIDLGIDHPTAICWFLYDTEEDVIYLVKTYAVAGENAATHTAAANSLFSHAPIVFPHDMDNREKGSGKTTRHYYEKAGLKNGIDFHNPDESIHVEPGIKEVYERMRDGRFKVFSTCTEFWREIRLYHRKDGKLVKKNDDVMDATRQGVVMLPRHGAPLTSRVGRPSVRRAMP